MTRSLLIDLDKVERDIELIRVRRDGYYFTDEMYHYYDGQIEVLEALNIFTLSQGYSTSPKPHD